MDEDQEFARRLLKSLALLCTKILPAKPNEDINNLLTIVEKALSECLRLIWNLFEIVILPLGLITTISKIALLLYARVPSRL